MDAPTSMTPGELAGDPVVPPMPASPLLATTVTPAATAFSSNTEIGSVPLSG